MSRRRRRALLSSGISSIISRGLQFHYDASNVAGTGVQPSDGALTTWTDLSGNNFSMIGTTSKPTFQNSSYNSHPGVNFNGSSNFMQTTAHALANFSTEGTFYFILNDTVVQPSSILCNNPDDSENRFNFHCPFAGGTIYFDFGSEAGGGRLSTPWGGVIDTPYVFAFTVTAAEGGQMNIYRDGVLIGNQNTSSSISLPTALIRMGVTTNDNTFYHGKMSELIGQNVFTNATDIATVSAVLLAKWS
jgi:hypothetical protein